MKKSRTLLSATLFALIICASTTQINAMDDPWCTPGYTCATAAQVLGVPDLVLGMGAAIFSVGKGVIYVNQTCKRGICRRDDGSLGLMGEAADAAREEEKKRKELGNEAWKFAVKGIQLLARGTLLWNAGTFGRLMLNDFCG